MRKRIAEAVVALLIISLAASALAATWTAYVNKATLNIYEDQDAHSRIIKKLKGGDEVVIEGRYDSWAGVYYDDANGDQQVGYVATKYLSFSMPQEFCGHEWSGWEVTRDATCAKKGELKRSCPKCGLEQTRELDKLEHEYGRWKVTEEATCTEEGEQSRTCEVCGYVQTRKLDKLPHEYGKWTVLEEPSCTQKGERVRRCVICAYRYTQELDKLPHEYGKWSVTKAATCTETGERVRKCAMCGRRDAQTLDKLPHEYGKWTVTRQPTCTKKGKRVRTCQVCGGEDSQHIDMLPHDYKWQVTVQTTDHSAGQRAKTCQVCGKVAATESFDPDGTLRRGARGDAVREAQQLLADQGYLKAGGVDGIFGGGLEKAVTRFQRDQGLEADGVIWPQTLKRMRHDFGEWETVAPLTRSSDGEYVRRCKECGYEEVRTVSAGVSFARRQRGEEVRTLQRLLNAMGYKAGTEDGIYGQKLDNAFGAFAAENDLDSVAEALRPVDVDNLVNGWIASLTDADWKGRGGKDSPVRLVLTVTPDAASEPNDVDVATHYTWKLTNLGSERCRFDALLLSYGDNPDFRSGNLVMAVGSGELRSDGANSLTGSFDVGVDWGDMSLNFSAVGTSVKTGKVWLSNVRAFER